MAGETQGLAMSDQPEDLLWYTDRTRIVDSLGHCQMLRALSTTSIVPGAPYGIQLKGTKIPLMTGIGAHGGLAPILAYCRDQYTRQDQVQAVLTTTDQITGELVFPLVPDLVVRTAIQAAQGEYWAVVEARGFAYLKDEPAVAELTREQNYLIEGMIWAWVLEVLPEVLLRGRIIECEQEGCYIIGCTCGLGDGILGREEHIARGCQGIALQNRPDFILETWHTGELEYHEFKTTGMDHSTFRDKWEVCIQMFATTLDVERRWGKNVASVYVHGLIKGKREGEYNWESGKKDGIIRQQSKFCYGYRKPGNPPMEEEEWAFDYDYQELDPATGEVKNRRLGKAYKKAGLWELPDHFIQEGMSKGEWWVKAMPPESRRKALILIGPLKRQDVVVPNFLRATIGEEQRWQGVVWQLYECTQSLAAQGIVDYWPHDDFQHLLHQLVPSSYECRRFGIRHTCIMEDICFRREGWADPLGSGKFIPRRPHHQPELDQALQRGLLLPDVGAGEDREEGE